MDHSRYHAAGMYRLHEEENRSATSNSVNGWRGCVGEGGARCVRLEGGKGGGSLGRRSRGGVGVRHLPIVVDCMRQKLQAGGMEQQGRSSIGRVVGWSDGLQVARDGGD